MAFLWFEAPEAGQDRIAGDRRDRRRVRLQLPLSYRCGDSNGRGTTRDLSAGGMMLELDRVLDPGTKIAIAIEWPIRLDGAHPLELVGEGEVLRSDASGTAMRIGGLQLRKAAADFAETRWAALGDPGRTNCCFTMRAVKMA